jgi:phospholipid methyltransferase
VLERAIATLARRRVSLGFLCGGATLLLAQPTPRSIAAGMSIAAVGELLRIWAAGHLNKAREVTSSGPYRWVAHPLYLGSSIMGIGLAIACASAAVAALIALYLAITLTAAMRREESFLRERFGDHYDRYRDASTRSQAVEASDAGARRFSLRQAFANREHRAVLGLIGVVVVLVLKATYTGSIARP